MPHDIPTALSVAAAIAVVVAFPMIGYIVRRRDKAVDEMRKENRDGHRVIHAKIETLESDRTKLYGEVQALREVAEMSKGSVSRDEFTALQADLREAKRLALDARNHSRRSRSGSPPSST